MKICPNCSAENKDFSKFCENCGTNISDVPETLPSASAVQNAPTFAQSTPPAPAAADAELRSHFVDPGETPRATIGNNYMQNLFSGGSISRGAAVLTDKRLYYYGKSYSGTGKDAVSATEEAIVPVESITLSRFIHHRDTGALIFGILFVVLGVILLAVAIGIPLIIAGGILLVRYFVSRSTIFEVAFAGGAFCFNVKWYPIVDMQDFQRQIYLIKDHEKNG